MKTTFSFYLLILIFCLTQKLWAKDITINWQKVNDAKLYQIELSKNQDFSSIIFKETSDSDKIILHLEEGNYFLRLRSVSQEDFPGPWSEPITINVKEEKKVEQITEENKKEENKKLEKKKNRELALSLTSYLTKISSSDTVAQKNISVDKLSMVGGTIDSNFYKNFGAKIEIRQGKAKYKVSSGETVKAKITFAEGILNYKFLNKEKLYLKANLGYLYYNYSISKKPLLFVSSKLKGLDIGLTFYYLFNNKFNGNLAIFYAPKLNLSEEPFNIAEENNNNLLKLSILGSYKLTNTFELFTGLQFEKFNTNYSGSSPFGSNLSHSDKYYNFLLGIKWRFKH